MSSAPTDGDRQAPLGVFDSGVGGLTVLSAIRARLPGESTLYLGDTARVPYGPKSPETVRRYALEAADFLLARGVKALVVACNTATARALEHVADRVPIPVIGVIAPGARAAVERSRGGPIGVIGTRGTVESGSYQAALRAIRPDAVVHVAACPLFVSLAEEGWTDGDVPRLAARRYLEPLLAREIDTLVLGCTHYPLLRPLLAEVAGSGVRLVDSGEATAEDLASLLDDAGLLAPEDAAPRARYYVTDEDTRFRALAERFLGAPLEHLERTAL